MRTKLSILLLLITQFVVSQNYQTIEEIDDACSQLGFSTDQEIQLAVERIVSKMGLARNFELRNCPNINNAVAKNIKDINGDLKRYILYDTDFIKRISENAQNDWSAISILAHEIGHHLNGHALNDKGSNHKWELEADEFSGFILAKMGASLEESQSAINTLRYEKATSTHPAKKDRLNKIKKGWLNGGGIATPTVDISSDLSNLKNYTKTFIEDINKKPSLIPVPSPFSNYIQQLNGGSIISLEYSRPSMRGRKIFGELYPFNELWRTGANKNTIINFSKEVMVNNTLLTAGKYAIYTLPNKAYWTVFFYKTTDNWGKPKSWDNSNVALSVKVRPEQTKFSIETFDISLTPTSFNTTSLDLAYENTLIRIPIKESNKSDIDEFATVINQVIGLTNFELLYRNNFKIQRNETFIIAEKLKFNDDIEIAGKFVKRGDYKLTGKITNNNYLKIELVDNENTGNKLFNNVKSRKIELSNAYSLISETVEGNGLLILNFIDFTDETANFQIKFNDEILILPIKLPTKNKVISNIESLVAINAAKPNDYYNAASYYYNNKIDINKAKEWIDIVVDSENKKFWQLHLKSKIYYEIGLKNQAISIARKALANAKSAGNKDYTKLITNNINKWE